jgi:hypothetical protein
VKLLQRLSEAERARGEYKQWQYDVASGIDFLNQGEGHSGYEVASAETIVKEWKSRELSDNPVLLVEAQLRAEKAERERDEAIYERDQARVDIADLKNQCDSCAANAYIANMPAMYDAVKRERDALQAEVARLREAMADAMELLTQLPVGDIPSEVTAEEIMDNPRDYDDAEWITGNLAYKTLESAMGKEKG